MIVKDKEGRARSVTTDEERAKMIEEAVANLSPVERKLVMAMLEEDGDEIVKVSRDHLYKYEMVSMEQFIDDDYYLGRSTSTLYPKVRQDLIDLFDGRFREVILAGAVGWGKTTFLSIAKCRVLYELSCMISPQEAFGLSPGSEMAIALVSKNLHLARVVLKTAVDDKLKLSPYFLEKWTPKFKRNMTMFPNNIYTTVGSYGSERILGVNVYSGAMDETNFAMAKKEQITTTVGKEKTAASYDKAEKVYTTLTRRIKSRFMRAGGDLPGMMILVSSAATVGSFTDRRIEDSRNDSTVFIRDYSNWGVMPETRFCGKRFFVLAGNSSIKSRIVGEEEVVDEKWAEQHNLRLISVPTEFKEDFEDNLEDAIRDIAGISTQAIFPYIGRVESVEKCVKDTPHPFTVEEWTYGEAGQFVWERLCERAERRLPGGYKEEVWRPKVNPHVLRWAHVDTSLSGDSTGVAVGHIPRWVEVVRRDEKMQRYTDLAPYIIIDFMLRIRPPPGDQIFLPEVRRLIYELMDHGFALMGFSADRYQSAEMLQKMKARGVKAELLSVDTSTAPYDSLKAAIYEHRIEFYRYTPFLTELKALEYDRGKGKVDHPLAGRKDVSDAVAGVSYGLTLHGARMPMITDIPLMPREDDSLSWVSPLIPATAVDRDVVERLKAQTQGGPLPVPFLIGSGD